MPRQRRSFDMLRRFSGTTRHAATFCYQRCFPRLIRHDRIGENRRRDDHNGEEKMLLMLPRCCHADDYYAAAFTFAVTFDI